MMMTFNDRAADDDLLCGAIRKSELLNRVCGDEEVMFELVELGMAECPRLRQTLRDAVSQEDKQAVEHAAHALKGVAGNLAAGEAFELALELEMAAHKQDSFSTASFLSRIEAAMEKVEAALARLIAEREQNHASACCR